MWSPRELAELAGTSRRAVRHYDELGLLPEPDRRSNGYGRYGVDHLVRLLRIRRLTGLGLTLAQIAALDDAQPPASLIQSLDAQLRGRVEELERSRAELAGMLERPGPVELPSDVAGRVAQLPSAQRALVVVLSRVLDEAAFEAYVGLLDPYRVNTQVVTFDRVGDDFDHSARVALAQGLAEHFEGFRSEHSVELTIVGRSLRSGESTQRTVDEAVRELFNSAQRDVLQRLLALLPDHAPHAGARDQPPTFGPPTRPHRA